MFSETLVLHKNIDNQFQVKITDRDRVVLKVTADSDIKIKFRIIDERKVVVSSFYLELIETGNFFQYSIPKEELDYLSEDQEYEFMATIETPVYDEKVTIDPLSGEEVVEQIVTGYREAPLYTDHDFKVMGSVVVHENFKDIVTETYSRTEPTHDDKAGKHFFGELVLNDGYLYSVEVVSTDGVSECAVSLQLHKQQHHPISAKNTQWDTKAIYYGVGATETKIPYAIPESLYARVVVHTTEPGKFNLVVKRIQR